MSQPSVVWVAQTFSHDGGSLHGVFANKQVAMEWLEFMHADRAAPAQSMREYYAEIGRKREWTYTAITCRDEAYEFTEGGDTYCVRPVTVREVATGGL